jgi:UrcA family protein
MKKIVSLALAAAAAMAPCPALAKNSVQIFEDGSYRIAVSYADLNLATEAGKRRLDNRVRAATNRVCTPSSAMSLKQVMVVPECRKRIAQSARPQIELAVRGAAAGVMVAERGGASGMAVAEGR